MPDQLEGDAADARRIKKRELDRKAQRLARERTKNRIAHLETMVQSLRRDDSNAQISTLVDQLAQITTERDNLIQVLKNLGTTIGRHVDKATAPDVQASGSSSRLLETPRHKVKPCYRQADSQLEQSTWGPSPEPTDDTPWESRPPILNGNIPINLAETGYTWNCPVKTTGELPTDNGMGLLENPVYSPDDMSMTIIPTPSPTMLWDEEDIIIPNSSACHCSTTLESNSWRIANEALGKSSKMARDEIVKNDLTSEDTPVLAVLEGWESVERAGKMTDSWRKLRTVDEVCFKGCSRTERLASLRMMHKLLTYHGDPSFERHSALPRWLWMRPSQAMAHSYAIDFFVWPGVRERFIFSQHQFCTNIFWELFQSSFKILWPYDFRDTYLRNKHTGKYQISPLFEERISDINTWTMSPDFFVRFPELYGDIPAYMGIPPPVSATDEETVVNSVRRELSRQRFNQSGGMVAKLQQK